SRGRRELLERHAMPGRLRELLSLSDVANADQQFLRSSDVQLSDRHFTRKLLARSSETAPHGVHPYIASLKPSFAPVAHTGAVSREETRRNQAFEVGACRVRR